MKKEIIPIIRQECRVTIKERGAWGQLLASGFQGKIEAGSYKTKKLKGGNGGKFTNITTLSRHTTQSSPGESFVTKRKKK